MTVIPLVQNILSSFETLKHDMDTISQNIKDTDSEICDILHDVELTSFNASEGYKLAKELQILRKRRREYKEYEEQLDMLRGFVNKHKWIVNDLKIMMMPELSPGTCYYSPEVILLLYSNCSLRKLFL